MPTISGLPERLREVVERQPFNGVARRLGVAAGIRPSHLKLILDGKSVPGGDVILRIVKAAGISADWLLTGQDTPEFKPGVPLAPDEENLLAIYRRARDKRGVGELVEAWVIREGRRGEKAAEPTAAYGQKKRRGKKPKPPG